VIVAERWRDNLLAVGPVGAVRVEVDRSRPGRRTQARTIRDLPAGTPVVLSASGRGAIRRCRDVAAQTGVVLEREFLAVPSAAAPAYLVENARGPVEVFLGTLLVTPPGTPFADMVDTALGVVRALSPWRLIGVLVAGRVLVGRCA
jgi:hypothetical protein